MPGSTYKLGQHGYYYHRGGGDLGEVKVKGIDHQIQFEYLRSGEPIIRSSRVNIEIFNFALNYSFVALEKLFFFRDEGVGHSKSFTKK